MWKRGTIYNHCQSEGLCYLCYVNDNSLCDITIMIYCTWRMVLVLGTQPDSWESWCYKKESTVTVYLCQHHISLIITRISMAEHKTTSTSHRYYCQSILLRKINIRISKIPIAYVLLSHSSLGWLYVFSLFPPPPLPPPQPPAQRLFLLTSKPFELNLRYLGQRKYRSGKMYWMTFWWTWPKITVVT